MSQTATQTAPMKSRRLRRARRRRLRAMRVLVLLHDHLMPPDDAASMTPEDVAPFKAEWDVLRTLRELGHEVQALPLGTDLAVIRERSAEFRPSITVNLIEAFNEFRSFDQHVVAYLECLRLRYTGCNPRGMTLARDKALTKKILHYHRIRTPAFAVFPLGRKIARPRSLPFPLLVKSATDDGSIGIAQASVVYSDAELKERVQFIHDVSMTDAIAEQYIEGRELYASVIGNRQLTVFPTWELRLDALPPGAPRIATQKVKTDLAYQKRFNIHSQRAELEVADERRIGQMARRVYRILGLSGYGRLDLRMTPAGEVYLIEANPNPQIAAGEDFADSAQAAGLDYPALLERIIKLGLQYRPHGLA